MNMKNFYTFLLSFLVNIIVFSQQQQVTYSIAPSVFEENTSITITINGNSINESAWGVTNNTLYMWAWAFDTNDTTQKGTPLNGTWNSSDEAAKFTYNAGNDTYTKTRDEFFGPEVKRRNMIGTYSLSAGYYDAYYEKAMRVRTVLREQFNTAFEACDVIVTPTTLGPAFAFGAKADPLNMYKEDILTVSSNLAGLPAISIPAGFDEATKLPLGLQIIGRQGDDATVLEIAKQIQAKTDWHQRRPKL